MSHVVTFYSYKGGVGRSMALANVAVILSRWGYKTLLVDWDLEAPGLEMFFSDLTDVQPIKESEGLIEMLHSRDYSWKELTAAISVPDGEQPIHLLSAGKVDDSYYARVREFDYNTFYDEQDGGELLEELRDQWREFYDIVLIDSRTGVTDIGDVCTIQMPDILVFLFTATEQGFGGAIDVATRANKARQSMIFERLRLKSLPILTRFEHTEFQLSQHWIDTFAERLAGIYNAWLPTSVAARDFLAATKVPYIPYFSFGEKLAVTEQNTRDSTGLGYAYESIASLLAHGLEQADLFMEDRTAYIERARSSARTNKKTTRSAVELQGKTRVFISASRQDRSFTLSLLTQLSVLEKTFRISIWSNQDILAGEKWRERIREEIEAAQVFLVIVSASYLKSERGQDELKMILDRTTNSNLLVIPVFLGQVDNDYIPKELQDVQGISVGYFDNSAYKRVTESVRKALSQLLD